MKILATSDLHLDQKENLAALKASIVRQSPSGKDCLILAGDICETEAQLEEVLALLRPHYQEIVWLPGNHELWIRPSQKEQYLSISKGSEEKYFRLVNICRRFSVHTPEDAFLELPNQTGGSFVLVPMFLLYDYSFRPEHISQDNALNWAMESNVMCSDEILILAQPYKNFPDWCAQRIAYTQQRLRTLKLNKETQLMLLNHFPLKESSFQLQHIPRFSIWCGTKQTENWHLDYPVKAVVSGHLHLPGHQVIDGVDFFEVSLGYPGQWDSTKNIFECFIEITP